MTSKTHLKLRQVYCENKNLEFIYCDRKFTNIYQNKNNI